MGNCVSTKPSSATDNQKKPPQQQESGSLELKGDINTNNVHESAEGDSDDYPDFETQYSEFRSRQFKDIQNNPSGDQSESEKDVDLIAAQWDLNIQDFKAHLAQYKISNQELKQLSEELEVEQVQGYDTKAYIRETISCFTTGDEKADLQNIDLLVGSLNHFTNQKPDELKKTMNEIRQMYFKLIKEGKEEAESIDIVQSKVYKGGVITTKLVALAHRGVDVAEAASHGAGNVMMASSMIVSPVTYGFSAILFLAQTGSNYRKVKQGKMTRAEFRKLAKYNGIGALGGIAGASGGAAAGFLIGTAVLPGIGSGIGTFVGAIAGGISGKKLSEKILDKIDETIEEHNRKHLKSQK